MALADKISYIHLTTSAADMLKNIHGRYIEQRIRLKNLRRTRLAKKMSTQDFVNLLTEDREVTPEANAYLLNEIDWRRSQIIDSAQRLQREIVGVAKTILEGIKSVKSLTKDPQYMFTPKKISGHFIRGLRGGDSHKFIYPNELKVLPLILGNGNHAIRVLGTLFSREHYNYLDNADRVYPNVFNTLTGEHYGGPIMLKTKINAVTVNMDAKTIKIDGVKRRFNYRTGSLAANWGPNTAQRNLGQILYDAIAMSVISAGQNNPNTVFDNDTLNMARSDYSNTSNRVLSTTNIPQERQNLFTRGVTYTINAAPEYEYNPETQELRKTDNFVKWVVANYMTAYPLPIETAQTILNANVLSTREANARLVSPARIGTTFKMRDLLL